MIIYKLENKVNGKIYIGQTKVKLSRRIAHHITDNKFPVEKAFNKYGLESFTLSVIDEADSRDILNEKERYWIKFFDCRLPKGYNCTNGGEGAEGYKHTTEALEKMRKAQTGRKHSPEHCRNAGLGRRGMSLSEETRRRMSVAHKGKSLPEQTKRNISIAKTGVKNPNYSRGRKLIDNIYPLFEVASNG